MSSSLQRFDPLYVGTARIGSCNYLLRTGKAKRGKLAQCKVDDLLLQTIRGTLERSKVPAESIEDVAVGMRAPVCLLFNEAHCYSGNVLQFGSAALPARIAQLAAGIPHTTPLMTVNRQCSSGDCALTAASRLSH